MKRITTLVLAMAFAFGGISAAQADGVDVKVKGHWQFAFGWAEGFNDSVHGSTDDNATDDNFIAKQRVRVQSNFIVSEELQGVLMFEIGKSDWGTGHARLDGDQTAVKVKRAYLDWVIPQTEVAVRMGLQGMVLPSATGFGNPVLEADVAGITVSAPINDMFAVTAFWARPFDAYGHVDGADKWDDEVDMIGLMLPVTGDGWKVTPWAMYMAVGGNSGIYDYMFDSQKFATYDTSKANPWTASNSERDNTSAWYLGGAFELTMFDPLTFGMDVIYGRMNEIDVTGQTMNDWSVTGGLEMAGWLVDARIDYAMDWATAGLFGWWGSGDDSDAWETGDLGRLPAFANDGGNFAPTTFGFAGTYGIAEDTYVSGTGTGTWGIGIQLADMSFVEDLSHTLRVAYYRGTNDSNNAEHRGDMLRMSSSDSLYLTDEDQAIEVNFDHQYKIYENLTAVVELGYIHLDTDHDTWNSYGNSDRDDTDNAYKAQVMLEYKF